MQVWCETPKSQLREAYNNLESRHDLFTEGYKSFKATSTHSLRTEWLHCYHSAFKSECHSCRCFWFIFRSSECFCGEIKDAAVDLVGKEKEKRFKPGCRVTNEQFPETNHTSKPLSASAVKSNITQENLWQIIKCQTAENSFLQKHRKQWTAAWLLGLQNASVWA